MSHDFAGLGGNNGDTNEDRPVLSAAELLDTKCTFQRWYDIALTLTGVPPLWLYNHNMVGENSHFEPLYARISHKRTNGLSFTERYGSSLPGCRSTSFVWYAVQTTSEIVTHWPAGCPSVAVFNCWRPSFRCGWCSTMEQSATWHRREWHTVTFPSWTRNIFIWQSYPSILF